MWVSLLLLSQRLMPSAGQDPQSEVTMTDVQSSGTVSPYRDRLCSRPASGPLLLESPPLGMPPSSVSPPGLCLSPRPSAPTSHLPHAPPKTPAPLRIHISLNLAQAPHFLGRLVWNIPSPASSQLTTSELIRAIHTVGEGVTLLLDEDALATGTPELVR